MWFENETIKEINVNEDKTEIIIKTDVTTYVFSGKSPYKNTSYLETEIKEIKKLVNKKILNFNSDYVEEGNENIYFYDFNTFENHVQLRFCGEDDTYYGASVDIERMLDKKQLYEEIKKHEESIEKIKKEIKERF